MSPDSDHAAKARDLAQQALTVLAYGARDTAEALAEVAHVYARLSVPADLTTVRLDLVTAELRARTARAEAAAQAAEDYAELTPRQRSARRVARLLLAACPDVPPSEIRAEAVPLAVIMERLGIGQTNASELRQGALTLLRDGYGIADASTEASLDPLGKA
ncbi:hypothetical protein ABZ135_23370 [Streptomyces sp. NPDC006339]|uniref:hypothetical protein n=1 Tax=Streptomyces sp. NPDC006339 TaxID=3156755 RepID=UPI0033BF75A3